MHVLWCECLLVLGFVLCACVQNAQNQADGRLRLSCEYKPFPLIHWEAIEGFLNCVLL